MSYVGRHPALHIHHAAAPSFEMAHRASLRTSGSGSSMAASMKERPSSCAIAPSAPTAALRRLLIGSRAQMPRAGMAPGEPSLPSESTAFSRTRSEEHTSELQSTNAHLVCSLLLEKKKKKTMIKTY